MLVSVPPRTPISERTQKRTGPMDRIPIGLRVPAEQLAEIQRRADAAQMTVTEYMIRCAIGDPIDSRSFEHRLNEMEAELDERICRLERYVELGS